VRIAVNASILDDRPTGMGIYGVSVVRELAGLMGGANRLTVFTGYPAAFADCDVDIIALSPLTQPRYGKAGGMCRFLWSQTGLPLQALGGRFDVLYQLTHHGLPYRLPRLAQVLTIQTDVEVAFEFPDQHRLQHYYFRYFVPRLLAASSAVITTSQYAMGVLQRTYGLDPLKLSYAYNAYDPACFNLGAGAGDSAVLVQYGLQPGQYLLAVGATYAHKNIGALLHAFGNSLDAGGPPRLCIVGYRASYLMPLLHRLSPELARRIVAIPYLPQAALASLYRSAFCLVVPSFHESFGMPCIEAMACGCPVVAARASALSEVCGDAAYYIDPSASHTITDAIARLAADPELTRGLRAAGLRRAGCFTWRATAEVVYDVLCRVYALREPKAAAVATRAGRVE
jgi:glycosyltransferase involved in cell wall biosynthesis